MKQIKEYFRKKLVYLKRHPQIIPLILLVISCCIYTFQLTKHSNATMFVINKSIAFNLFVTTLASMLAIFTFVGVKKLNKSALFPTILTIILVGLQLFLDIYYLKTMHYETVLREVPVPTVNEGSVIPESVAWIWVHVCSLIITLLSIILLPVYKKLLQKINTSINSDQTANTVQTENSDIKTSLDERDTNE